MSKNEIICTLLDKGYTERDRDVYIKGNIYWVMSRYFFEIRLAVNSNFSRTWVGIFDYKDVDLDFIEKIFSEIE